MRDLASPLDGFLSPFGAVRGRVFSPLSLFASGEAGAWYDPSDLSTLYQDSLGTTPVTAAGQPVGLVLDKSQGLTLGPELVTNGTFDTDTGWTFVGSNWVISGGVATFDGGTGYDAMRQNISVVVGRTYEVRFDITSVTLGGLRVDLGVTTIFSNANSIGSYRAIVTATGVRLDFSNSVSAAASFTVDNISVRELSGNHLTQATAAARPVYQTAGGLHWLEFDGVDDFLVSPTLVTPVDKAQFFSGVDVQGTGGQKAVVVRGDPFGGTRGMGIYAPRDATLEIGATVQASVTSTYNDASVDNAAFEAPYRSVLTAIGDEADSSLLLRTNGVQVATSTVAAGGNFTDSSVAVGRRSAASATLFFDGNIYGLVLRFGANLDADTIAATETYLAAKTGVVI